MNENTVGLDVRASSFSLRVEPRSFDPLAPMVLTVAVEFSVEHPTGRITYSASDAAFIDDDLTRFAAESKVLLHEGRGHAHLSAVADLLELTVTGADSGFELTIRAEEPDTGWGFGTVQCGIPIPREAAESIDEGVRSLVSYFRERQEGAV